MYNIHDPFSARENILSRFVAHLYKGGFKAGTIKSYLAAVPHAQIALGLENLHAYGEHDPIRVCVEGVKRLTNKPAQARFSIILELLGQLCQAWLAELKDDAWMLWAAVTMCFFGFLCTGEVVIPTVSSIDPSVHLTVANVSMDGHSFPVYLAVRIKASKTDPFRLHGHDYLLRKDKLSHCTVAAVPSYLVKRGQILGLSQENRTPHF